MTLSVSLRCEERVLDNGLRVLVHEERSVPLVAVNLWYHVGSRDERPGRTGFAHLFEHLMFEGSAHVPPGHFDRLLEAAGAVNNGSTSQDRTNYWETLPSHALELALWLESDRMGWLPAAITQEKLDAQRDVVKNERRQSYENRPYGLAWERLHELLYPEGHPYRWPVIGSMEDLSRATLEDVVDFFSTYYVPGNATLAIAGDVRSDEAFEAAARWFGEIAPGATPPRAHVAPVRLPDEKRDVLHDRVHLPRIYMGWHSPAAFEAGDAELDAVSHVLAHGRASRLHRSLVHDREIAQDVDAFQRSGRSGSVFHVVATARPGVSLARLEQAVREQLAELTEHGVAEEEMERARNVIQTSFVDALETVGGFGGRADRLNFYAFHTGDPNGAEADLARYTALSRESVLAAAGLWLGGAPCAVLEVVPHAAGDGAG
jgi:zinc protease